MCSNRKYLAAIWTYLRPSSPTPRDNCERKESKPKSWRTRSRRWRWTSKLFRFSKRRYGRHDACGMCIMNCTSIIRDNPLFWFQVDLYCDDFNAEREARQKIAGEKVDLEEQIRKIKLRQNQLNTDVDAALGGVSAAVFLFFCQLLSLCSVFSGCRRTSAHATLQRS